MKIDTQRFRVREGATVKLQKCPTGVKPFNKSKGDYKDLLEKHVEKRGALQNLQGLKMTYPDPPAHGEELAACRKQLEEEGA